MGCNLSLGNTTSSQETLFKYELSSPWHQSPTILNQTLLSAAENCIRHTPWGESASDKKSERPWEAERERERERDHKRKRERPKRDERKTKKGREKGEREREREKGSSLPLSRSLSGDRQLSLQSPVVGAPCRAGQMDEEGEASSPDARHYRRGEVTTRHRRLYSPELTEWGLIWQPSKPWVGPPNTLNLGSRFRAAHYYL